MAERRNIIPGRCIRPPRALVLVLTGIVALAWMGRHVAADDDASEGAYADVYARRLLARGDANRDGVVDRKEAEQIRVDATSLDANADGTLDLAELHGARIPYLRTTGPRRLNLHYKQTPQEDLYLDLYYPRSPAAAACPVVIYTHGGGWTTGSKQNIAAGALKDVAAGLLNAGFCVAAVNYRLCGVDSAVVVRDCVQDAQDAVDYLGRRAADLGIDATRAFVLGDSAGGQIAQMLLLSAPRGDAADRAGVGPGCRIRAGVAWYAPCDFERPELFAGDKAERADRFGGRILGKAASADDAAGMFREVSPVAHLAPDSPPLLLVHGNRDTTIPVAHAYYMKHRAAALGAPVETVIVTNAGHNWRPADGPIDPPIDAIVARTVDFLASKTLAPRVGERRTENSSRQGTTVED